MSLRRLHSALEILSIEEVEKGREELSRRHFSPEERAEVGGRRVQTTAGFLAAKRALVRVWEDLGSGRVPCERDFVLTHRESGAPHLVSAPSGLNPDVKVHVSISHTRQFAYGLAVVTEVFRG